MARNVDEILANCKELKDNEDYPNWTDAEKAEFAAGLENQERVYTRAWLLEEAKHNENGPRVAEIMGEIAVESVAYLNQPPTKIKAVSSATAKKVEEK